MVQCSISLGQSPKDLAVMRSGVARSSRRCFFQIQSAVLLGSPRVRCGGRPSAVARYRRGGQAVEGGGEIHSRMAEGKVHELTLGQFARLTCHRGYPVLPIREVSPECIPIWPKDILSNGPNTRMLEISCQKRIRAAMLSDQRSQYPETTLPDECSTRQSRNCRARSCARRDPFRGAIRAAQPA